MGSEIGENNYLDAFVGFQLHLPTNFGNCCRGESHFIKVDTVKNEKVLQLTEKDITGDVPTIRRRNEGLNPFPLLESDGEGFWLLLPFQIRRNPIRVVVVARPRSRGFIGILNGFRGDGDIFLLKTKMLFFVVTK